MRNPLAEQLVLFILYVVIGKLGLALATMHPSASPVWWGAGLAIAAVLILGSRAWPAILAGAFLVNVTTVPAIVPSLGIAIGNTLEAIVAAYFIRRHAGGLRVFERPQDVLKFAAIVALLSTPISATVGVTSLAVFQHVDWQGFAVVWLTWWLGDMGGALLITPLLVLLMERSAALYTGGRLFEGMFLLLLLFLVTTSIFGGWLPISSSNWPIQFLSVPILVWIALRFQLRETAFAMVFFASITVWGTVQGYGPFGALPQAESLLLLQMFLSVVAVTILPLAASVRQQREIEAALRDTQNDLEKRIQERTLELATTNAALRAEVIERTRAAEALQTQAQILTAMTEGVNVADDKGYIMFNNPAFEAIFGYERGELLGQHVSILNDCSPEESWRLVQAITEELNAHGEWTGVFHNKRKDGTRIRTRARIHALKVATVRRFVSVQEDITERCQAEEALRESEHRFRSLFETAKDVIYVLAPNGTMTALNPAFEHVTGWAPEEWIGKPFADLIHPEDRPVLRSAFERAFCQEPGTDELRIRTRAGHYRIAEVTTTGQRKGDVVVGILGIARDVTERKRQEESLRQAHAQLEQRVAERTQELAAANAQLVEKIQDLEMFHDVVVDRELKMIQVEKEMERLKQTLERTPER